MNTLRPTDQALARSTLAKASLRVLPLLALGYLVAFMDRVNVGFAALRMNADLGFSNTVFGLGAGLFYLSYALLEIPASALIPRVGARRWIARIMIVWGLLATAMMLVRTPGEFYAIRLLLGAAEAGFFPAVVYHLAHWFPKSGRGRAISRFYIAGPACSIVMGAVSAKLLGLDGVGGLRGWQWLFLAQGTPAILVGLAVLRGLPDSPATVGWLSPDERGWIAAELARDAAAIGEPARHDLLATILDPFVLLVGLFGFLSTGAFVTFTLSAPLLLKGMTGASAGWIGGLVSVGGVLGLLSMLVTGAISDRLGQRFTTLLASSAIFTAGLVVLALVRGPTAIAATYLILSTAWPAVTLSYIMSWPDMFHVRVLAAGSAMVNCMSQLGGFLMPFAWGVARDATGGFRAGLLGLALVCGAAVLVGQLVRRQVPRQVG